MPTLTPRQKQILDFVKIYIKKNGISPTFEEIGRYTKKTFSTVHEHVEALITKGFLSKINNSSRGIQLIGQSEMVKIPLLGTIAAGQPIEVVREREVIAVAKNTLPRQGSFFALKVAGESMIDENIHDGDYVIVKQQSTAENGEKVVALLENNQATLKKIFKEKNRIRLQPANKKMAPIFVRPGDIQIQGTVIDIIKNPSTTPSLELFTHNKIQQQVFKDTALPLPLNQIILGDAIEGMKKIPSNSIDLIIADPPYNLSKGASLTWSAEQKIKGFGGAWNKVMENWDNMSLAEYFNFTIAWLTEAKRILKKTGSIWVFGTYHNIGVINVIFQMLNIEIINEVAWYKRNSFPNLSGRRLTASHETMLWGHAGDGKRKYYFDYKLSKDYFDTADNIKPQGKQMRTVWDIPNNKNPEEIKFGKHPTQKPVKICDRIIQISSKDGDIVLSPFAGAGTECVAAKKLNRHFIGFELEEQYKKIAEKRLDNISITKKLI